MADAIKISTVVTQIAAKSITVTNAVGSSVTLSIKDTSAMPEAINQESCPMLVPRPVDFVTNLRITRDSYGADAAYKTVAYTLNYLFYYAPMLQGAKFLSKYDEFVTAATAVVLSLGTNTNVTGSTDFMPGTINSFGVVTAADGTEYYGCVIPIEVSQFMET